MISLIPHWLVHKISGYPAGIRLPKMVKWYSQENANYTPVLYPRKPFWSANEPRTGDPLGGGDYRYWCGLQSTSMCKNTGFATCRACGEVVIVKKERKAHMKDVCGPLLEKAYKILRCSTECIICKKVTHRKVYGLPICDRDCEFEWEYTTATPVGLRYILDDSIGGIK